MRLSCEKTTTTLEGNYLEDRYHHYLNYVYLYVKLVPVKCVVF